VACGGDSFVCWLSSTGLVVLVVLVLMQWHYARIIAAAVLLLRSENPVSSQIEKLIPDSQVICQSGKPHAFIRVAHAFLLGGHGECFLRREQQRSPLE
jgi:hypothetical protein